MKFLWAGVIEYKNNKWQQSVVAKAVSEPSISPDGNTILFKNGYIERTSDGWSEMKSLGEPFASIDIMRSAISSNGTIILIPIPRSWIRLCAIHVWLTVNMRRRNHWALSLASADIMLTPTLRRMKAILFLIA